MRHRGLLSTVLIWTLVSEVFCSENESEIDFPTPPAFFEQINDDHVVDRVTTGSLNSTTSTTTTLTPSSADLPRLLFGPFVRREDVVNNFASKFNANTSGDYSNDRGMWILYEVTNWFLKKIQPNDFPDYLLTDDDLKSHRNLLLSLKQNHKQWIKYEQGFIIAAGICLLMTLVFTVCYIFYLCCCRCCCCSDNEQEKLRDKRMDAFRRNCCNVVLTVLVVTMMFTVVCAMFANHFVHGALTNLPKNLRSTADDLTLYKEETNQRFKKLLVDDFRTLNHTFSQALTGGAGVLVERIKQSTGASSLDRLYQISEKSERFVQNLNYIENQVLPSFDAESSQLKRNLTKIRQWVADDLHKCLNGAEESEEKNDCRTAVNIVDFYKSVPEKITSATHFFDDTKRQLSKIASYQLASKLHPALNQFEGLKKKVDDVVSANKKLVVDQMNELGRNLQYAATNISSELQQVDISSAKFYVDEYETDVLSYEFYRWIGGYVVAGVLGLVVVALGLGLMYGLCGRRPGFYEDHCCVWTRGGRLYCGAIILAVSTLLPFMVTTVGLFLIGGNSQTIICSSLDNVNEQNGFLNIMQRLIDISKSNTDIRRDSMVFETLLENKLKNLISGCSENKTFYDILTFDKRYRLLSMKDSKPEVYRQLYSYFDYPQKLNIKMGFNDFISPELESSLNEVSKVTVNRISPKFIAELRRNATMFDFDEKLRQIKELSNSNNGDLQILLRTLIPAFELLRKDSAISLRKKLLFMAENLTAINENSVDMVKDVPLLMVSAKNAQGLLNFNLTNYLQNASLHMIKDLQSYFDVYFDTMKNQLNTEVTSCDPVRQTFSSAISAVCHDVLLPFNGFWACIAVCLILLIPSVIIASALRDLYFNTDPYTGNESYANVEVNDRHQRVNAYLMTDGYMSVDNAATIKSSARNRSNGSAWRTPANSMYFEDSNRPPPPYRSPPGKHK